MVGYSLPDPDAVIVAPATYNTITKWANVVIGPREPHQPGDGAADDFPWEEILDTVT
jgi:hypothetical protein